MSLRKIPDKFLNTTVHIYRESAAVDAVGDFTTSETIAYTSVPAYVEPKRSDIEFELQGKIHYQSHLCFINNYDPALREILPGDYIHDVETDLKHVVLGAQPLQTMRKHVNNSGHLRLNLKHIGDSRFQYIRTKTSAAKGYISSV